MHIYLHECAPAYMCPYISKHMNIHICVPIYMYTYIRIHSHTCKYIHQSNVWDGSGAKDPIEYIDIYIYICTYMYI